MQNNIGDARRSYGLTLESGKFSQEEAASYFKVSLSTYQKWEQGTGKSLKVETLCDMADLYSVSIDYLLCRTDNPSFRPVRNPGRYERELRQLVDNMDSEQRDLLMQNARAFSALSEKDGSINEGIKLAGTVDAVRE